MADVKTIRNYTSELIKATFENRKPHSIPSEISLQQLVEVATKGQMPYLLFNSLLVKYVLSQQVVSDSL